MLSYISQWRRNPSVLDDLIAQGKEASSAFSRWLESTGRYPFDFNEWRSIINDVAPGNPDNGRLSIKSRYMVMDLRDNSTVQTIRETAEAGRYKKFVMLVGAAHAQGLRNRLDDPGWDITIVEKEDTEHFIEQMKSLRDIGARAFPDTALDFGLGVKGKSGSSTSESGSAGFAGMPPLLVQRGGFFANEPYANIDNMMKLKQLQERSAHQLIATQLIDERDNVAYELFMNKRYPKGSLPEHIPLVLQSPMQYLRLEWYNASIITARMIGSITAGRITKLFELINGMILDISQALYYTKYKYNAVAMTNFTGYPDSSIEQYLSVEGGNAVKRAFLKVWEANRFDLQTVLAHWIRYMHFAVKSYGVSEEIWPAMYPGHPVRPAIFSLMGIERSIPRPRTSADEEERPEPERGGGGVLVSIAEVLRQKMSDS